MSTQMRARCFAQASCSSRLFMVRKSYEPQVTSPLLSSVLRIVASLLAQMAARRLRRPSVLNQFQEDVAVARLGRAMRQTARQGGGDRVRATTIPRRCNPGKPAGRRGMTPRALDGASAQHTGNRHDGQHHTIVVVDPAKDINWVAFGSGVAAPPFAQELRAHGTGHVILNSELDRPWSQYFCCMLIGSADFVRRSPIATKRVVRAMMRATDICAAKPDWVAQRLVDRGLTTRYNYARQGLEDVSYRAWRDYDAEDAVRFWALRERELGMSPDKIIATGTDWRFLKEVRKELGI